MSILFLEFKQGYCMKRKVFCIIGILLLFILLIFINSCNFLNATENEERVNKSVIIESLNSVVIEILNWNMDTYPFYSPPIVLLQYGIDYFKIVDIRAFIRDDTDSRRFSLVQPSNDLTMMDGKIVVMPTGISLFRRANGIFDGSNYDSTSNYIRGWVIVYYIN